MTRHKYTNALCVVLTLLMLAGTLLFMRGESLGITVAHAQPAYASALFSTDKVHTLDIVVDEEDWKGLLADANAKEYIAAHVVIDGEAVKNVGLRTKGNSSLATIASSDSDRYSFKIEFDHYSDGQTYKGLDKLALNNIAQDNTYLKDYICYQMMVAFGAEAPLSSFVWITVNGEDWGLYLAVEGIEDAFASRNYGADYGQLYKPDTMDMNDRGGDDRPDMPEGFGGGEFPFGEGMEMPEGFPFDEGMEMPEGFPGMGGFGNRGDNESASATEIPGEGEDRPGGFGGFGGSSGTTLSYVDEEIDSYSVIFDSAIFKNVTEADKTRLIQSLKQMNAGENLDEVVNVEEVLRYFVAHNFVLNFDSYTGTMVHNYYLHENDGQLSMIAWDYNLAFGAFSMGGGRSGTSADAATTAANYPIDTPTSGAEMEDRPLLYQMLTNYMDEYHVLFEEFIEYFSSGEFEAMYDNAVSMISEYVEKDPTAFCTYEEFDKAQEALREFCLLRAQSIEKQLDGEISSTSEGQAESGNANFVDASHVDMEAMGSSGMGFGRARDDQQTADASATATTMEPPEGFPDVSAKDEQLESTEETASEEQRSDKARQWSGNTQSVADGSMKYWMLGGSMILLVLGLFIAWRYRKW